MTERETGRQETGRPDTSPASPRSYCVFSGSSPGARPEYREASVRLGQLLAERGIGLVYGGAHVGLMGAVADAVLEAGGRVTGVIPRSLVAQDVAHRGLDDLRIVDSMHERKQMMADLSDGFVALPGGLGTFEELLEILTWAQLGEHAKPCGALDVCGYFGPLVRMLDHAVQERFLKPEHRSLLLTATQPERLLDELVKRPTTVVGKWLDRGSRSGATSN